MATNEKVALKPLKRKKKLNAFTVFDVVLAIIMILFMATIVLPFVHIIAVSFSGNGAVMRGEVGFLPVDFTLYTYKEIFKDGSFFTAYGNTIAYTVVGTAMSLITTAMGAYALSRGQLVGHKLFTLMITITMFFSGGMIPTYIAMSSYNLINTFWVMILPSLVSTWNLIVMRSFFIAYPQEIIESGQLDGLRDPGVFFRLVLPTSKASLATIGLYYAVAYWNAYMNARLYIRDEALYPVQHLLQIMLQSAGTDTGEEGKLVGLTVRYASIIITVVPIMCVYPWLQKYFVKGAMVGAVKG